MKSRLTGLLACALLVVCGAVAGADSFHDKPVREVVVEVWPGWLDEETIQLRVTMSLARHDWVGPYGGALLNAVQFAQRASAMLYADTVRGVYAGRPPKRSQLAFADGLDFFIKGGMVIDVHGRMAQIPNTRCQYPEGTRVELVVRPETVKLFRSDSRCASPMCFTGRVTRVVYMGSVAEYDIDVDGTSLLAVVASPAEHGLFNVGEEVQVGFAVNVAHPLVVR